MREDASGPRPYEPNPRYAPLGEPVVLGWSATLASLSAFPRVLAVDGPGVLDWESVAAGIERALIDRGIAVRRVDTRDSFAAWDRITERTSSGLLADDPDFAPLSSASLTAYFDALPTARPSADTVTLVIGPGAALVPYDVLWYADQPKRYAEAAIVSGEARNLGQPEGTGPGTTRRLFYIDWPILDRHRRAFVPVVDRWIDVQDPGAPTSIGRDSLRRTAASLARRPFRTRPTFNSASWGGHWGQRTLGLSPDARNSGVGYELIAPESGVLIGESDALVEVPLAVLVTLEPVSLMGAAIHDIFETSFPIRFDYLDTVDGGNLSIHCHPRADYMRDVFGWQYTQHETYYVMVTSPDRRVYLGLRGDVDADAFRRDAHEASEDGRPFDIERHVQTFPATQHQLFVIPAGTPHGSGEGNVILEVSATPYLYSLRFYDWLREDDQGRQRPVHVEHAFANLNTARTGSAVAQDLVQAPRSLEVGDGWREEVIGSLPEMFFEVRRLVLGPGSRSTHEMDGRFHVLNVVEGEGVEIESRGGDRHSLVYAETIVIPAAVGFYTIRTVGSKDVRVVKALVR